MLLTIDVGNTQIYIGAFEGSLLRASFRRVSTGAVTADELGVFILSALSACGVKAAQIKKIAIASVVPDLTRSIAHCAQKYFKLTPFIVDSRVKMKLNLNGGPVDGLGADRIAAIEGALALYPGKDLLVVDFGTANTFCAVSKEGNYLGGAISAGIGLSMAALAGGAALLSNVEIKNPGRAAGLDTTTQLQAGLFYTGLGSIKEICARLKQECFTGGPALVIGTGGLGRLYEKEDVFDVYAPDLVLSGLKVLAEKNNSL